MKEAKDLFSKQAQTYASFRPTYPDSLYQFLFSITKQFHNAWDCATGNGQVAIKLADQFEQVQATDLSSKQIEYAVRKDNIHYSIQRAEHTNFADSSFDLITVGTALHWFDFDAFYKEAKRVAKDGAAIVVWAYSMFRSTPEIDAIIDGYGYGFLHEYWQPERKYVDDEYKTIPFPFEEITVPKMDIELKWNFDNIIGYANSWSSTQEYINRHSHNPIGMLEEQLAKELPRDQYIDVRIPLCIRAGIISK